MFNVSYKLVLKSGIQEANHTNITFSEVDDIISTLSDPGPDAQNLISIEIKINRVADDSY